MAALQPGQQPHTRVPGLHLGPLDFFQRQRRGAAAIHGQRRVRLHNRYPGQLWPRRARRAASAHLAGLPHVQQRRGGSGAIALVRRHPFRRRQHHRPAGGPPRRVASLVQGADLFRRHRRGHRQRRHQRGGVRQGSADFLDAHRRRRQQPAAGGGRDLPRRQPGRGECHLPRRGDDPRGHAKRARQSKPRRTLDGAGTRRRPRHSDRDLEQRTQRGCGRHVAAWCAARRACAGHGRGFGANAKFVDWAR